MNFTKVVVIFAHFLSPSRKEQNRTFTKNSYGTFECDWPGDRVWERREKRFCPWGSGLFAETRSESKKKKNVLQRWTDAFSVLSMVIVIYGVLTDPAPRQFVWWYPMRLWIRIILVRSGSASDQMGDLDPHQSQSKHSGEGGFVVTEMQPSMRENAHYSLFFLFFIN